MCKREYIVIVLYLVLLCI